MGCNSPQQIPRSRLLSRVAKTSFFSAISFHHSPDTKSLPNCRLAACSGKASSKITTCDVFFANVYGKKWWIFPRVPGYSVISDHESSKFKRFCSYTKDDSLIAKILISSHIPRTYKSKARIPTHLSSLALEKITVILIFGVPKDRAVLKTKNWWKRQPQQCSSGGFQKRKLLNTCTWVFDSSSQKKNIIYIKDRCLSIWRFCL